VFEKDNFELLKKKILPKFRVFEKDNFEIFFQFLKFSKLFPRHFDFFNFYDIFTTLADVGVIDGVGVVPLPPLSSKNRFVLLVVGAVVGLH